MMEMKIKTAWLLVCAWWIYFITALVLYIHFKVAWVNTFDALGGAALTFLLSVWYVVDRIRYRGGRPRTSRWLIGPYGTPRRNPNYRPRRSPDEAETPTHPKF